MENNGWTRKEIDATLRREEEDEEWFKCCLCKKVFSGPPAMKVHHDEHLKELKKPEMLIKNMNQQKNERNLSFYDPFAPLENNTFPDDLELTLAPPGSAPKIPAFNLKKLWNEERNKKRVGNFFNSYDELTPVPPASRARAPPPSLSLELTLAIGSDNDEPDVSLKLGLA